MGGILELLSKQVRKEPVDGVDLWFRPPSIDRVLEVEQFNQTQEMRDKLPVMEAVIRECLCHEDGTPANSEELAAINHLGLAMTCEVFQAAMKAGGIGEDEEEDLLKNSPARQDSSSC